MHNLLSVSKRLRRVLDGNDTFAQGGHQILKIRRPKKKIPDWVNDNQKIKEMLFRAFPKMISNSNQRKRAGRWARVINLYFKQQWSRGQIAEELDWTYCAVDQAIRGIKRAAEGRRFDGRGMLTGKRGRPKGVKNKI